MIVTIWAKQHFSNKLSFLSIPWSNAKFTCVLRLEVFWFSQQILNIEDINKQGQNLVLLPFFPSNTRVCQQHNRKHYLLSCYCSSRTFSIVSLLLSLNTNVIPYQQLCTIEDETLLTFTQYCLYSVPLQIQQPKSNYFSYFLNSNKFYHS